MRKAKPKTIIDETTASDVRREIREGVGYGKPPAHTRFKTGVSGNPKGRPRRNAESEAPSAISEMLLAEAERLVAVVENGEERLISLKEAVVKATLKSAVRGNSYAQERTLVRIEKAERERAARIEAGNAAASHHVARCRGEIEAARTAGLPEPEFHPHPDDVVIAAGEPFRIVGPATREDAAIFARAIEMRDLLVMQSTLAPPPGERGISVEMLLALIFDRRLPPRMRLSGDAWSLMVWYAGRMPRRDLKRRVRQGWRDFGIDIPTGFALPPLDAVKL